MDTFDRFFTDLFDELLGLEKETQVDNLQNKYVIRCALPGYQRESVSVTTTDVGTVRVRATRQSPAATFSRVYEIPSDADESAVQATYLDGMLHVELPKRKSASRGYTVTVK